jgi:hypothetical protein
MNDGKLTADFADLTDEESPSIFSLYLRNPRDPRSHSGVPKSPLCRGSTASYARRRELI